MTRLRHWLIPIGLTALAAIGVFVLPWWVPLREPSFSPSYTYGFNNAAAWVALAAILALLAVWRLAQPASTPSTDTAQSLAELLDFANSPIPRPLRLAALAFALGALIGIAWWFWYLPYAYFGEIQYFLPRIDLMLQGFRPYRDFQFSYGPSLLVLPYALYQIGSTSVEYAYEITLMIHWALGTFCLYYVVQSLGGSWRRELVFLLIAFCFINFTFGLNYTPLRFALPLASLVALHRCAGGSANSAQALLPRFLALCVLLPMLNFAVSPEMGLAVVAAFGIYALALARTPLRRLTWGVLAVSLCLPLAVLVFSRDYFHSILTYAGGGNNLPVFPTIHALAYVGALLFLLPWLAVLAWRGRTAVSAMAAALLVLFGLQMIPALGRCDPRHVFMNGMGVILLTLALWSLRHPRTFKFGALAYGVVFLGALQLSSWNTYRDFFNRAADAHTRMAKWREINGEPDWSKFGEESIFRYDKLLPPAEDFRELLAYGKIGAPFGVEEPVDRFLKFTGHNVPEYYPGPVIDVFRESDVARKLQDIKRMDTIIVPAPIYEGAGRIDSIAQATRDSQYLSDVLVLPLDLKVRQTPYLPSSRIMAAIAPEFEPVGKFRRYVIARRKKS